MSGVPLHYIDLRAFCYATEDDKRVEAALRTLLPAEVELSVSESEGYFGDRILVFSARVESTEDMRTVLSGIGDLPDEERARVRSELDQRVNENCSVFLTLSKQAAFNREVTLGDGITIRGKVEAYPANQDRAVETVADLLDGL